jgi:hypothetical protein
VTRLRALHRALWACAVAMTTAACAGPAVIRVVDGEEHVGPFVHPNTYSAYARGAVAESEGRLDAAAAAYALALKSTDDALVHARLGAVLCKMGHHIAAREQFERGNEADPRGAVVFRERARCALSTKKWDEALQASQTALELDPDDRESVAIRAEALDRSGRPRDADALRAEASRKAGGPAPEGTDAPHPTSADVRAGADASPSLRVWRGEVADVDEALARGALDEASARASRIRLSRSAFAARALAFGHVAYAREVARRVAAADPRDASARLVAAAGADLAQDDTALARALGSSEPLGPPSDLSRMLFAEVLIRREGKAAAAAFVSAPFLDRSREDPLEERVRLRLLAAMSPTAARE